MDHYAESIRMLAESTGLDPDTDPTDFYESVSVYCRSLLDTEKENAAKARAEKESAWAAMAQARGESSKLQEERDSWKEEAHKWQTMHEESDKSWGHWRHLRLEHLERVQNAIEQAVGSEDGLDRSSAEVILEAIKYALSLFSVPSVPKDARAEGKEKP